MSKYEPLAKFLAEQEGDLVTVTFAKVSALLAGKLPQSAFDHRPWWANRFDGNDAQNSGWQSVGWETKDVDMKKQLVTFVRTVKTRADFTDSPYVKPLTIDDAKKGLAAKFAVNPDSIDIIIRG